jgi:hypothetical protein
VLSLRVILFCASPAQRSWTSVAWIQVAKQSIYSLVCTSPTTQSCLHFSTSPTTQAITCISSITTHFTHLLALLQPHNQTLACTSSTTQSITCLHFFNHTLLALLQPHNQSLACISSITTQSITCLHLNHAINHLLAPLQHAFFILQQKQSLPVLLSSGPG